jgi:hypothetical protein
VAFLRPASVAVHNDGDVLRQTPRIQLIEQARFFTIFGFEQLRRLHVWILKNTIANLRGPVDGGPISVATLYTAKLTQQLGARNGAFHGEYL